MKVDVSFVLDYPKNCADVWIIFSKEERPPDFDMDLARTLDKIEKIASSSFSGVVSLTSQKNLEAPIHRYRIRVTLTPAATGGLDRLLDLLKNSVKATDFSHEHE